VGYVSKSSGLEEGDKRHFADEIITLHYQTFSETKSE
jgi:hypothetical protein